jgi:hypothetical protein
MGHVQRLFAEEHPTLYRPVPFPAPVRPRHVTPQTSERSEKLERARAQLPDTVRAAVQSGAELRFRQRGELREAALATGRAELDELLDGGLPRGTLVEVVGRASSGRHSLVLETLAAATHRGEAAALVDLGEQLDPQAAAAVGVQLERLLWLRPQWLSDAVTAGELVVTAGFPAVVLDLGLPPVRGRRVPAAGWLRLVRSATEHRTVLLVSAPYRLSGAAADIVISAGPARGVWAGGGSSPRLLEEIATRLTLAKHRGRRPEGSVRLQLTAPETVSAPVTPPASEPAEPAATSAVS